MEKYLILFNFLCPFRMDLLLNCQVLREKIKGGKLKERKVWYRVLWQKEVVLFHFVCFCSTRD
jgi:hypothetical protein